MFYCGIDIAKYKHEASVIDMSGKALINSISFANDKQGCEKVLAVFEKFEILPDDVIIGMEATGHYWLSVYTFFLELGYTVKVINPIQSEAFRKMYIRQTKNDSDDVIIGMEATGHYWLSVYTFFLELGYTVKVINPIQSEAFRKMYIRQTKNDSKDSYIIAQIMRFGEYSATSLSEENIIALRQLSRYRLALVDACGDCKRRVIALLDQVFPEYDKLFSDTFGSSSTELLLNCPTPEDMLAISTRKLTNILNKASHGRFGKEKAEELKAAAKNTFGIAFAKDAFSFQIKQLMQQIVFLENQLSELEEQISSLLHETNQYITTITGIGDVLGAIIVSEIGDINRFERPNQLVAFAGLDVTVKQSGEFSGTKNKISKRGSPYLRRAIWFAAQRAAFCDTVLSEYYQSLRARGKHHLTAVGGVARKLCNIIFVILKENRPYLPTPPKNHQNLS